ncbi:hypothetical protein N7486_010162 [Penicillium sp. IBT 16267x]|nr:hypothetical protein N7486_010162 [Penicillium sp. IBT 16267x]
MPPRRWPGRGVNPKHDSRTLAEAWVKLDVDKKEIEKTIIKILRKIYHAAQPSPVRFHSSTQRNKLKEVIIECLDQMPEGIQVAAKRNKVRTTHNLYRIIQLERSGWDVTSRPRRSLPPRTASEPRLSRRISRPRGTAPDFVHASPEVTSGWENTINSDYEPPDQLRDEESGEESENQPSDGSESEAEESEYTESHERTPFPPPWLSSAPKEDSPDMASEEEYDYQPNYYTENESDESGPEVPPHEQTPLPPHLRTPFNVDSSDGESEEEPEQKSGSESDNRSQRSMSYDEAPRDYDQTSDTAEEEHEGEWEEQDTDGESEPIEVDEQQSRDASQAVSSEESGEDSEEETKPTESEPEDGSERSSNDSSSNEESEDEAGNRTDHIPDEESEARSEAGHEDGSETESEAGSDAGSEARSEAGSEAKAESEDGSEDNRSSEELDNHLEDRTDHLPEGSEGESASASEDRSEAESEAGSEDGAEDSRSSEEPDDQHGEALPEDKHIYDYEDSRPITETQDRPRIELDYDSNGEDQFENETDNGFDDEENEEEIGPESIPDEEMKDASEAEGENESEDVSDKEMKDVSPAGKARTDPESIGDESMQDVSSAGKFKSDESMIDVSSAGKAKTNPVIISDEEMEDASEDEAENKSQASSGEEQSNASNDGSEDESENDSEGQSSEEQECSSDDESDGSAGSLEEERENSSNKAEAFEFDRPSVVPNADVDIIRADDPYRPLSIRLNDFLKDRTNPRCQSLDGDWIDISQLHFKTFQKRLMNEGLFRLGADHIWWNSSALKDINLSEVDIPQGDESRLTELSMITVIKRSIDAYYPGLGITMGDEDRLGLPRPSFTVIIRNANTEGGILDRSREPSLSRPNSARSSRYASSLTRSWWDRLFRSGIHDAPQTPGEKRKSPDSDVDSSDRPARRTRPSPDLERPYNPLRNLNALQFHDASKPQDASDPKDEPLSEEASYTQSALRSRRVLDNLSSLQFHDAMDFDETESMQGIKTTNSARSNASPQNQTFGNYREGANRLIASTIAGISPPVPMAQELLGADLWVHHAPISPSKTLLSVKEQCLNDMLISAPNPLSLRLRNLRIEYESPPRPPVPSPDPWWSMQPRVRSKTDEEVILQSKLVTAETPRKLVPFSALSTGKPIRTRRPAFLASQSCGKPTEINWAAMQILTRVSIRQPRTRGQSGRTERVNRGTRNGKG